MAVYKLKENYMFCGYKGLPFGIKDIKSGMVSFFNREEYELVLMMDGTTEVDTDYFSQRQKDFINRLIKEEVVDTLENEEAIKPFQEYTEYPAMYKESAQWSITGQCNYRCKHCFMSSPDANFANPTKEQCMDTIAQLAKCGIDRVEITGGEPLVSPWFYDILDELKKYDIQLRTLYSNGALVNEKLLDELEKRDMKPSFQISYDGVGWHDWLRGIDGAEESVIRAFNLLHDRGYDVSSSMCLHKHNLDVLNESIRLLDSLGVSYLKTNIASPAGLWAKEREHFLTEDETYSYMFEKAIPEYLEDHLHIGVQFSGLISIEPGRRVYVPYSKFSGREDALDKYACDAMKNSVYISPERYILPCMVMVGTPIQDQFPSLDNEALDSILSESVYTQACMIKGSDVINYNEKCKECNYRFLCGGGCRACPDNENCTSIKDVDETSCRFFLNGWYDKSKDLAEKIQR